MTVQELIDDLMEIKDKSREVTVVVEETATFNPVVQDFGDGNIIIGN